MKNWKDVRKFLVGGAVRDAALGLQPKDQDYLIVGETIESMEALGFQRVGKNTTAPVFIHPEDPNKHEYSIPRKEVSTGPGYNDFTYITDNVTIEDDLRRRDITINAMAYDEKKHWLTDPFGGDRDLHHGIIRPVDTETFQEDPVRILRAARFAARYNFKFVETLPELTKTMIRKGMLDSVPAERILLELRKALTYRHRDYKPSEFFRKLDELSALDTCLPVLAKMNAIPQPKEHHAEGSVFEHTMLALDAGYGLMANIGFKDDEMFDILMAILYHDIGKIETPSEEWPKHNGHNKRGLGLLDSVRVRLKIPNRAYGFMSFIAQEHMYFHTLKEMGASSLRKLMDRMKVNHTVVLLELFMICGWADEMGRLPIGFEKVLEWNDKKQLLCNILYEYRKVKFKPDDPNPVDRLVQDRVAAVKRGLKGHNKMIYLTCGGKRHFLEIENVGH